MTTDNLLIHHASEQSDLNQHNHDEKSQIEDVSQSMLRKGKALAIERDESHPVDSLSRFDKSLPRERSFNEEMDGIISNGKNTVANTIEALPDRQTSISSKSSESNSSIFGRANNIPAPTAENIRELRKQARADNDPERLLAFALYLIDAVSQVNIDDNDPMKGTKTREKMILEAHKIIKKLATQGLGLGKTAYTEAQYLLANCHGSGSIGLPVDYDKAFSLYLQASKQNHPAATYRTAVCYELGAGTRRDYNHAMQFYRKAANLSHVEAMYKLGMVLLKGQLNQPRQPREGIFWLKRAAAAATAEVPHAVHQLALVYENDDTATVIRDEQYSFNLFAQAADLGYAPSQCKLGTCYEYGLLKCDVDAEQSIIWYKRAADQGIPEAELAVSGWYLTGAEGVLQQSDDEAYHWARKAAEKGDAVGEFTVGYFTEIGIGTKPDLEEAKRWYMLAMSRGNRRAMERLKELKRAADRTQQHHDKDKNKNCVIM
ncbi:hypothetical protein VKS41_000655 [Umbelopsis sp. WA50703]|jgi:TPR repeat protein